MKRLNISLDHPSIPLNARRKMVDEEQLRIRLKEKIIFQKKTTKKTKNVLDNYGASVGNGNQQ